MGLTEKEREDFSYALHIGKATRLEQALWAALTEAERERDDLKKFLAGESSLVTDVYVSPSILAERLMMAQARVRQLEEEHARLRVALDEAVHELEPVAAAINPALREKLSKYRALLAGGDEK